MKELKKKKWIAWTICGFLCYGVLVFVINWGPLFVLRSQYEKDSPEYYFISRQMQVSSYRGCKFVYEKEGSFLICYIEGYNKSGRVTNAEYSIAWKGVSTYHNIDMTQLSVCINYAYANSVDIYYDQMNGTYLVVIEPKNTYLLGEESADGLQTVKDSAGNIYKRFDNHNHFGAAALYYLYDFDPEGLDLFCIHPEGSMQQIGKIYTNPENHSMQNRQ